MRIKLTLCILLLAACTAEVTAQKLSVKKGRIVYSTPAREKGQSDVLQLRCDPISVVRVGFIGVGMRGSGAVTRFTNLEGVEIKAVCDLEQLNIDRVQKTLKNKKLPEATAYIGSPDEWKKLCERDDIDLVYICTDWLTHTPMAVYAMQHGKHVAIEVPAATSIKECWDLVNTAEQTRRHCMMLENCCYDFFELATLNMAQQGLFGQIMHAEGAYIHDLRSLNFNERTKNSSLTGYWNFWRKRYDEQHTGNPYPTHGLGPVCQILNIHRGDRMQSLVSMSTSQAGMTDYAKQRFGENSPQAQQTYDLGDMNTTVIRTAHGKTIMIQHDVTSPRPYSRLHVVSGTKGFAQKYPARQLAFDPDAHKSLSDKQIDSILTKYEFPFVTQIKDQAKKVGGHGGMDFIMDYRLVYCLQNGLPLDQDVYDAAEWSCLVELTEQSVRRGNIPAEVPDFTRGAWERVKGFSFAFK